MSSILPPEVQELPAGQIVEFLVGFTNKAEYDFVVESVDAAFHYPLDHSFVVQNFSALRYNRDVKPTNEITVAYSFIPADAFTGRPLSLAINLNYRDLEGRMFRDTVFNETMNIVEFSEGIDTEMIFLYLIMASVVILALVAGQQFLGSYTKKRMSGNRSSDAQKNKQTSGIDYDWIPKATLQQIKIKRLVVTLCGRIFTPDFMTEIENFSPEMLNLAGKFAEKPIVSENVERAFREKATLKYKAIFYVNVRKHFIAGIRHTLNKCPLEKDGFLEALRFLSPINMKDSRSIADIAAMARKIAIGASSDVAQAEWLLLRKENEPREDITRIDHFWSHYFGLVNERGDTKYPELTKLFEAMLTLSPGNADAECGFSRSGRILGEDQALMSERVLDARFMVYDTLRLYGGKPKRFVITKELLNLARSARLNALVLYFLLDKSPKGSPRRSPRLRKGKSADSGEE
ncbi:hypothetical protein QYM36_001928 [Artemia franciscana]|uniref:Translocon-associated protein subunit alpha n=1 Tax=Artemia franciscana TaxID=6661 RepID=A0AA88LEE5_ARTSF|nr:hypothetical protein QYM36_001928 [Artemia franciscana]